MVQRRRAFPHRGGGVSFSTRRALLLLGTALFMGVAADFLARTVYDRLNLAIWIMLALLAALLLARRGVVQVPRQSYVLAGPRCCSRPASRAGRRSHLCGRPAGGAQSHRAGGAAVGAGPPSGRRAHALRAGRLRKRRRRDLGRASRGREGHRVGHGAGTSPRARHRRRAGRIHGHHSGPAHPRIAPEPGRSALRACAPVDPDAAPRSVGRTCRDHRYCQLAGGWISPLGVRRRAGARTGGAGERPNCVPGDRGGHRRRRGPVPRVRRRGGPLSLCR